MDFYAKTLRAVADGVRRFALPPAVAADGLRSIWRKLMGDVELPGEFYEAVRLVSRVKATPAELAAALERVAGRVERESERERQDHGCEEEAEEGEEG